MILLAVKSLNVTPRFLPVIVVVVPPPGGPDFGEKFVIAGAGHCWPSVIIAIEHSSPTLQLDVVSHHPHWKLVPTLVLTHAEQPVSENKQS